MDRAFLQEQWTTQWLVCATLVIAASSETHLRIFTSYFLVQCTDRTNFMDVFKKGAPGHCLDRGLTCLRSWLTELATQSTALLLSPPGSNQQLWAQYHRLAMTGLFFYTNLSGISSRSLLDSESSMRAGTALLRHAGLPRLLPCHFFGKLA